MYGQQEDSGTEVQVWLVKRKDCAHSRPGQCSTMMALRCIDREALR
ncbi:hypothetical protein C5167_014415 [Papaver somniferum]|uniref:Uncharacterized protein n=1 Tax=Papaver somniferum TaxID=3469 RepID=A0A4Y7J756_PAPSO|nr:hypothetical protein C5167_014415 [Papaver somniferum]